MFWRKVLTSECLTKISAWSLFPGGLSGFKQNHENLCDNSLQLQECPEGGGGGGASAVPPTLPQSIPTTPDIENAELTPILPFLFLGNEHDAQDLEKMQRMNIGYVINVTTHLPLYHYEKGMFNYKRLPATDSNKQNLRQYFEEAFEFIGNYPSLEILLVYFFTCCKNLKWIFCFTSYPEGCIRPYLLFLGCQKCWAPHVSTCSHLWHIQLSSLGVQFLSIDSDIYLQVSKFRKPQKNETFVIPSSWFLLHFSFCSGFQPIFHTNCS